MTAKSFVVASGLCALLAVAIISTWALLSQYWVQQQMLDQNVDLLQRERDWADSTKMLRAENHLLRVQIDGMIAGQVKIKLQIARVDTAIDSVKAALRIEHD